MSDKLLKKANELFKAAPNLRGGIVMGIQLVRDSLNLNAEDKQALQQAIDIISGVTKYVKAPKRPTEITKLEDQADEDEAVNASEPETRTLPRRESPKPEVKKEEPEKKEEPKVEEKTEEKKKIVRPWDRKDVIRRPRRR